MALLRTSAAYASKYAAALLLLRKRSAHHGSAAPSPTLPFLRAAPLLHRCAHWLWIHNAFMRSWLWTAAAYDALGRRIQRTAYR